MKKYCSHCSIKLIKLKSKLLGYCKDCNTDLEYRVSFSVRKGFRKTQIER